MNESGLKPIGYFVVVALDDTEGKVGSIFLPPSAKDAGDLATQEGVIEAVGPHAFNWADSWPEGSRPEVGQRVLFRRFSGHLHERNGRKWRILNDKDDLIAIIEPPVAVAQQEAA